MNTRHRTALRALSFAALVAAAPAAAASVSPSQGFDECGLIVQGVECQRLFEDPTGTRWLLEEYEDFQVGDHVHVVGTPDPNCISFCFVGCVLGNTIDDCGDPTTPYCFCDAGAPCGNHDAGAGCGTSQGQGALLSGGGSASVAADDLVLAASHVPHFQNGLLYMGGAAAQTPFGDGLRCVDPGGIGLFRFPVRNAGADAGFHEAGIVGHSQANFPPAGQIQPGDTWYFQAWFRDPQGPCGATFNLSNAVSVDFTA